MKINITYIVIAIILLITAGSLSCKKKGAAPIVITEGIEKVTGTRTTIKASVFKGDGISERGICWSSSPSPTTDGDHITDNSGMNPFTCEIKGLNQNSVYYARAYAINSDGTGYGSDITINTTSLAIGDTYGGGTIYYFLKSGDYGFDPNIKHGLIAAPEDLTTTMAWTNTPGVATGATDQVIGTGNVNTTTIVSKLGSGSYAAKVCYDMTLAGYSVWFLPSRAELEKIYEQKAFVDNIQAGLYWSSSEDISSTAIAVSLYNGVAFIHNKTEKWNVRPVREF
jgi:hypothetical protein